MTRHEKSMVARAFAAVAFTLTAACSDVAGPLPEIGPIELPSAAFVAPDLGPCPDLAVEGAVLQFRAFATGDQVYRWNGTAWVLFAPDARLYADANHTALVGTHYAGPTWESVAGGKVVGQVLKRCTVSAEDVQWLLLGIKSNTGPGVFQQATHIQRVNTRGGVAPATPGTAIGDEVRVPYSTEYYFYRAQ